MHYLTDGKSTLDLTQGELVQATTDELHEFLFRASAEIADLRAKLAQSDEQLGKTNTFAADVISKVNELELQLNGEQAIARNLEKKVLEARSIDSSERPDRCPMFLRMDARPYPQAAVCGHRINPDGTCTNAANHG